MDANGKDDLKTQFATREGIYRLMTLSEYSRPNRVGYQTNQSNPQVRVSLVSLPSAVPQTNNAALLQQQLMHHNNQQQQQQSTTTTTSSNASSVASQQQQQQHHHQHQHHPHHPHLGAAPGTSGLVQSPSLMTTLGNGGVQHTLMCDDGTMQYMQQQQQQSSPTGGGALMPLLQNGGAPSGGDRICFNYGKELYVYAYRGCKKLSADLSKPVDKKLYKGTNPSCHDFNETVAQCDGAPLLVGFTTGQIQLVQPGKREPGRLYNEERFIDKTKVTCLKWLPGSANHFLASHASGHLYLYNEDLPCTPSTPTYQPLRTGDGYTVHTAKAKQPRNPLHRWTFANSTAAHGAAINEMAFSPCGQLLAIVSQDGFLRVFHYERQELLGVARSYFGGFLCVCWSPDGKYIVVGGEDDLVTVWSMAERRVVARGQGHRSWVSVVAFDPYTSYTASWDGPDFSDDENPANDGIGAYRCFTGSGATGDEPLLLRGGGSDEPGRRGARPMSSSSTIPDKLGTSYRLGSVSQDTQLCLWDITEDVLRQSHEIRQRLGSHDPPVLLQGNGGVTRGATVAGSPTETAQASGGDATTTTAADHSDGKLHNHHMGNSVATGKHTTLRSNSEQHTSSSSSSGKANKHDGSGGSGSSHSGGGLTALTSLTQRLSNFSFGSDSKKSSSDGATSHKKSFTLSKQSSSASAANHHPHGGSFQAGGSASPSSAAAAAPFLVTSTPQKRGLTLDRSNSTFNSTAASSTGVAGASTSSTTSDATTAATAHSPTGSIVPSYDPMRLIGTAVCPRYDECPLLEPLVCKKIAHERLTALIFREDCFLTACQDGLIYTWARPGFSNLPQHIIPTATSPNAPSGGTVV